MNTNELPGLDYDRKASEEFVLSMSKGSTIDLQFPPKITSDSKSAVWQETHHKGYEELALWMGAKARDISIELNYVVWGKFTIEKIRTICQDIKLHLYVGVDPTDGGNVVPSQDKYPFISISGWKVLDASKGRPNFRVTSVNLTYSREYVGFGNDCWPQHTKIDLKCKLISSAGAAYAGKAPYIKETNFKSGTVPSLSPNWA
jgi:hypothetical protein